MREIQTIETVIMNGTCVQSRMNILHAIHKADELNVTDQGRFISIPALIKKYLVHQPG